MLATPEDPPSATQLLALELRRQEAWERGNAALLLALSLPLLGILAVGGVAAFFPQTFPDNVLLAGFVGTLLATTVAGVRSFLRFRLARRLEHKLNEEFPAELIAILPFEPLLPGQRFGHQCIEVATPQLLRVRHRRGAFLALAVAMGATLAALIFLALGALMIVQASRGGVSPRAAEFFAVHGLAGLFLALYTTPIGWTLDTTAGEFSLLTVRAGFWIRRTRIPLAAIGAPARRDPDPDHPVLIVTTPVGDRVLLQLMPPTPRHGVRLRASALRHEAMNRWIADNFAFHAARMLAGDAGLTQTS